MFNVVTVHLQSRSDADQGGFEPREPHFQYVRGVGPKCEDSLLKCVFLTAANALPGRGKQLKLKGLMKLKPPFVIVLSG